jgi:uncharacterized protein YjbJ (UPF0337 family)
MAGIKCINCNFVGTLENQGITFDGKTGDIPISRSFKHMGNNPFSGNLRYQCSRCETIILVDPMDVLGAVGAVILTDVREKRRKKSFFEWFFLSRRNTMKSSTKDEAKGKFHEVKGKVKEVAGKLSDNPNLEAEGTVEKITGKVQEKIGQVKKVWGQ